MKTTISTTIGTEKNRISVALGCDTVSIMFAGGHDAMKGQLHITVNDAMDLIDCVSAAINSSKEHPTTQQ